MQKEGTDFCIGVLALQGGFAKHIEKLEALNITAKPIRRASELADCSGLILPGGESTAMTTLLDSDFKETLMSFKKPIFGTCAGLIMLAKLGLLSVAVKRNAYGRQLDSFSAEILVEGDPCEALFIRAPKIIAVLEDKVKVIARASGDPILVEQGAILASTFHPELTADNKIHKYFIRKCYDQKDSSINSGR